MRFIKLSQCHTQPDGDKKRNKEKPEDPNSQSSKCVIDAIFIMNFPKFPHA